jgi:putative DNA primase/helicase
MPTATLEYPTLAFPSELQALPQWVAWKYVPDPDRPKPKKIPVCPHTGDNASVTDRATWGTPTQALDRCARDHLAGIGFVLTSEDPFVGIDLDNCRNPDTGLIEDWAAKIVVAMRTYTEISPSGTGLHLLLKGTLPPGGRRRGGVEMYDTARFLTITGDHLEGTPPTVEPRQAELAALHAAVWPDSGGLRAARLPVDPSPPVSDDAVLARVLNCRIGEKFGRLFAGSTLGYPSASEADLAFCAYLAFWTQDIEQIDRLYRRSGLMREKWEREDYRERTIQLAIDTTPCVFAPPISLQGNQSERTWGGALIEQALMWTEG